MKSPSPEQYYKFAHHCANEGRNVLADIILIQSAILGHEKGIKECEQRGLDLKLERYQKKIVKELRSEVCDHSGSSPISQNVKTPKKRTKVSGPGITGEDLAYYSTISFIGIVLLFIGAAIFMHVFDLAPEPYPEQRESNLYEAWQSAKSDRDYWYRTAEKRYNKDGELSNAFKKYLEADRAADAAWQRYRDYSNTLEERGKPQEVASGGGSSASGIRQNGEAVPGIHTYEDDLSLSETEHKPLANRKAEQKTFEERKGENVREAQRRLGLMIDSIHEELGYNLDKTDIETIDEDYSNAISLLDNKEKSMKQKISAIKAASQAHSQYINHKKILPDLNEDEKRNGDEISNLNEIKTSIYAKSFDLFRMLKALDKDFYSLKDFDTTNSLRLLETKNRGMPSDSFRIFSFYIDEEHVLSELFGKGLIYMPNITPRIKQDDGLRSELFAFMVSDPAKQLEHLQRELSKLKRTRDFHHSYRVESKRLRNVYEHKLSIYPLDRAQLEEFPSMKADLENELAKIKEWKGSLHQSNNLVGLIQKAEEPKVAIRSHSNSASARYQSEAVPEIRTHDGYLNASESERKAWADGKAQQYQNHGYDRVTGEELKAALDAFYSH